MRGMLGGRAISTRIKPSESIVPCACWFAIGALRLLVCDRSKELLNTVVVDVAICRTPEILGRWLNQFIARIEPNETDERLNRSLDDRYVSIRPDLNGVSFLFAAMSAVNATAVDQVLTQGVGKVRGAVFRRHFSWSAAV